MRIELKVIPGAKQSTIVGWHGQRLKIRVAAPPEKGKANAAVVALLAEALNIPKSDVRIVSGHSSSQKSVDIHGLSEEELLLCLPER